MPRDIFMRPVWEEGIQQSLIAAIKTSLSCCKFNQFVECVQAGSEYKNAGIETIWPANIWSCGQFFSIEKFVCVLKDLSENQNQLNHVHVIHWDRLTKVSASRNTHFSNCVNLQLCNFVNVIPNSGRDNRAKLAASFESNTFTSTTTLKEYSSLRFMDSDTPGVINTAVWWTVLAFFKELATTRAPSE